MKIEGAYTLPVEPLRAYALLQDPEVLGHCLPGCDHLEKIGDDEYAMKMKMVISSIEGLFSGKVRVADPSPPDTFRLVVEGSGKAGFLKGEGLLTLVAADTATEVRYTGDVQVGGTIARVGQRLLDATAKLVIRKFFQRLATSVEEGLKSPMPTSPFADADLP